MGDQGITSHRRVINNTPRVRWMEDTTDGVRDMKWLLVRGKDSGLKGRNFRGTDNPQGRAHVHGQCCEVPGR
jgi:hypothetical protein